MKPGGYKRLVLAAILLILGAFVMTADEAAQLDERSKRMKVKFPSALRAKEHVRIKKRQREFLAVPTPDEDTPTPPTTQDPVLRSLGAAQPNESVVVLEVNALRHSKVGQRLIDCLSPDARANMDEMREKVGFDILEDFDRLALYGENITISGHFENFNWDQKDAQRFQEYGDRARMYANYVTNADGEESIQNYTAIWNNEMLIIGDDEASLQKTIDVIEGRQEMTNTAIREGDTYGEAYGQITAELLIKMLPPDMEHLSDLIRDNIRGAKINFDAMDNIALSASLGPANESSQLTDLARSLGGSLSLGLSAARIAGDDDLTQLLEFARVSDRGDEIKLDLALPEDYVNRHLDKICENIRMKGQRPADGPTYVEVEEWDEDEEYDDEEYDDEDAEYDGEDEEYDEQDEEFEEEIQVGP